MQDDYFSQERKIFSISDSLDPKSSQVYIIIVL